MPGGNQRADKASGRLRLALCALICATALLALASSASAGTISVANLNDSGAGSLRDAIAKAAVNETIVLPVGQITLTTGPLAFEKNLTITGAGPGASTLSGNNASRIFTITGTPTVTLQGLTITQGKKHERGGNECCWHTHAR